MVNSVLGFLHPFIPSPQFLNIGPSITCNNNIVFQSQASWGRLELKVESQQEPQIRVQAHEWGPSTQEEKK
jgi:hypothetical protein